MNLAYQMTDQPRSCVNLNGNQVVLRMVASGASAASGLRWEVLSIQRVWAAHPRVGCQIDG